MGQEGIFGTVKKKEPMKKDKKMKLKYLEVIQTILKNGWEVVPLCYYKDFKREDRVIGLRHDIDDNMPVARNMAYLECQLGVNSTYFLLTSHPYYKNGKLFANFFHQLRHEVGIHYDILTIVTQLNYNVHKHLIAVLAQLAKMGIKVWGVSAHGSAMASKNNFKGWEYFYDYTEEDKPIVLMNQETGDKKTLVMGIHPLAEYGLLYDAIKLDKVNYISDSHGVLRINRDLKKTPNTEEDLINFIENGEGKTMMLFHPQYWEM